MKDRWQQSLEAAVAAYDTPMPWARGETRKAMFSRRKNSVKQAQKPTVLQAQSA
jgi:hypothetical protein